jgi:hypothetical protein
MTNTSKIEPLYTILSFVQPAAAVALLIHLAKSNVAV